MACVRDCASRHVICVCPRDDQKTRDRKDQWKDPKKPNTDYVDPSRKPKK
jgi:hypothetical protein